MTAEDQREVLDFLQAGPPFQNRDRGGQDVRRIDTPCAIIFLSGDRAWKLKRAVRFPYLDSSTPSLRHQALANELALNRRTAPNLYLGLHAITRRPDGGLTLDDPGELLDWVLEMRGFADGTLLSELAGGPALSFGLLQDLADDIVAFHGCANVVFEPDGFERFAAVVGLDISAMEAHADLLGDQAVVAVSRALRAALKAGEALLRERSAAGRVRHLHGDLHLANIAAIDGRATPFDCLEFDNELATADTLYDLAFLLMDLWQRDLRAEANAVFNRYLDLCAEDEGGIALIPLFLASRAVVRAHVGAAQARHSGSDPALAEGARRYLRLARSLAPWLGRAPGASAATCCASVSRGRCPKRACPVLPIRRRRARPPMPR